MKATDKPQATALALQELEQIDQICGEFEEQWRRGLTPAIESFLPEARGGFRSELMVELLKLDIDYRDRAGCTLSRQGYLSRFPLDSLEIDRASSGPLDTDSGPHDLPAKCLEFTMRYELLHFHARGGLGEIYLARDVRLDRDVAVKFPRNRTPGSAEQRRMAQEARITGRLKHPGIVPVHAAYQGEGDSICYVMQFIQGETLKKAVEQFHQDQQGLADKFRTWDFRRMLQRFVALCSTVAYAHGEGVIHRDIKPSNVMIGKFGETFLLDWGIAKVVDVETFGSATNDATTVDPLASAKSFDEKIYPNSTSETPGNVSFGTWPNGDGNAGGQTVPGQPIGTPEFASPEQVLGDIKAHGPPSDVYSLGATLYFLLTARQAVDAEDLANLRTAAAIRRIQPPRSFDSRIPIELNAICMKALSFEIGDRYRTPTELADDIERYLADEPVSVLRPSMWSRIGRWARRRPKRASAMVAGLAVALLAVVCGSWLLNKKADQLAKLVRVQEGTNLELSAAKQSTQQRAEDAILALHTLSDRVVQQWFSKQTTFTDFEKGFLNDLLGQYDALADAFSDDPRSRELRAQGYYNAAQIHKLLGNSEQALVSTDAVIELLTPVPETLSENVGMLLGTGYIDRGRLLIERGEFDSGFAAISSSLEYFRQLVKYYPDTPQYHLLLLKAQNQLGSAWVSRGESERAANIFHSNLKSLDALISAHPQNLDYQDMNVLSLGNLAIARSQLGELDAAEKAYEKARSIYSEMDQRGELYTEAHRALGNVNNLIGLARLAYRQNDRGRADETYEQAIADCQKLIAEFPTLAKAHFHMASCLYFSALISRDRKEYERALETSRSAVDSAIKCVEMSPQTVAFHETRATAQLMHAQLQKLAGHFEQAEAEFTLAQQFARERYDLTPTTELRIKADNMLGDLAMLLHRRNDRAAARSTLEELIVRLESDEATRTHPEAIASLEKSRALLKKWTSH